MGRLEVHKSGCVRGSYGCLQRLVKLIILLELFHTVLHYKQVKSTGILLHYPCCNIFVCNFSITKAYEDAILGRVLYFKTHAFTFCTLIICFAEKKLKDYFFNVGKHSETSAEKWENKNYVDKKSMDDKILYHLLKACCYILCTFTIMLPSFCVSAYPPGSHQNLRMHLKCTVICDI